VIYRLGVTGPLRPTNAVSEGSLVEWLSSLLFLAGRRGIGLLKCQGGNGAPARLCLRRVPRNFRLLCCFVGRRNELGSDDLQLGHPECSNEVNAQKEDNLHNPWWGSRQLCSTRRLPGDHPAIPLRWLLQRQGWPAAPGRQWMRPYRRACLDSAYFLLATPFTTPVALEKGGLVRAGSGSIPRPGSGGAASFALGCCCTPQKLPALGPLRIASKTRASARAATALKPATKYANHPQLRPSRAWAHPA